MSPSSQSKVSLHFHFLHLGPPSPSPTPLPSGYQHGCLCLYVTYICFLGCGGGWRCTRELRFWFLDLGILNFCWIPGLLSFKFTSVFRKHVLNHFVFSIEKITDSWAFLPYAQLNIDKIRFYFRGKAISVLGIPCFISPLPSCPTSQKIIYLQSKDETTWLNTLKVTLKSQIVYIMIFKKIKEEVIWSHMWICIYWLKKKKFINACFKWSSKPQDVIDFALILLLMIIKLLWVSTFSLGL